jgi:endonuclease YncB( thermonuclease family)
MIGDDPVPDGTDETLRPTADRVRRVLGGGHMRPAFREELRRELVAARQAAIGTDARHLAPAAAIRARPGTGRPPGRRAARRRRRRARLGWAGAAAAALVAVIVLAVYGLPFGGHTTSARVSVASNVDGSASSSPTAPVRLTFSQPLDHAATASAVRLSPATQVRSVWDGDTLTLTPVHGFAPNSAYVLTVDHTVARTAQGAPLAADMHVLFGTASVAGPGPHPISGFAAPALASTPMSAAGERSEAVVTRDGSTLLTGGSQGVVRIRNGAATPLGTTADAVCVSRSRQSVAFLTRGGTGTRIVFADALGSPSSSVPVSADPGSPLGWINDAEVVYVGAGRLMAVDRQGHVRTLSGVPVDAAKDTVVLAPGGRYVYLRPATGDPGRVVDLQTNAIHALLGGTGEVAFSADGATVAWFAESAGQPALQVAASSGGPVLTVQLPVAPGDHLSGVGLSPDTYHFLYSVTASGQHTELRLATLPDGRTIASGGAAGRSPRWSTSGRQFTVFRGGQLETMAVPETGTDRQAAMQGLAMAFARAEISGDAGAQRALAAPDVALPTLPGITRAAVLWLLPAPGSTVIARVRLTIDPQPGQPVARQAEERLTLGPRSSDGLLAVLAASVEEFRSAPGAPQVIRCDTDTSPGSVLLTFDSDLDPDSVPAAIGLSTADGKAVPGTASYDATTRTVTVRPDSAPATAAVVLVDTGLRDVRGQRPAADLRIAVSLDGP